jgi:PAS domain S-box-containing protein
LNRIEGDQVTHYRHDPEDPGSLADNLVYALSEDPSGALWVGTWKGLDRLDPETGNFAHFPHDPEDPSSLSENTVYSLFVDSNGELWVGTYGGLNRFHREDGTFTRYVYDPQDPDSLSANPVFAIQQDSSGMMWVGTQGGGLNRLDPQTEKFQRYQYDPEDPESIAADSVWSIYPDPGGDLWLGTSAGLNRFDPQSGRFHSYASQDGLPSGSVNGILPDSQGSLWLSTDQGLYRFNPQNEAVDIYDQSDGLISDDFEKKGYFRDQGGELMFGTSKGLIAFDPALIEENPYVPPVLITNLDLENRPVPIESGSALEQSILQTEAVELPYWNRILTFEFSALNFRAPQENRYRYTLEGFDDRWYEAGSDQRRVTYTNLDPGIYIFRVVGSNDDGVWNESGTSIQVQVMPPWWESTWFRAGLVLLLSALLLSAHRLRTRSILQQNRRLEEAVAERTGKLEETNRVLQEEISAHRQTEESLRASEVRYRTIFDTTGTATAIAAPDATILLANAKYAQLTGYTKEELEGAIKWTQFLYPEDAERVIGYSQLRWKDPLTAPKNYEYRFVNREGVVRHVLATVAIIPGTSLVVASLLDITTRKELELELQRQNTRYVRATRAAGAGVIEWDLNTGLFYIDPSIKAVLGYQDREIHNDLEAWLNLICLEDRQCTKEAIEAALRGETKDYLCEHRMLARDGSLRWILSTGQVLRDEGGQPLRMIGTDRDITLRKLAELQLKESEERFRTVWETAGDAMVLIDESGFVLAANPAFFDLFGFTEDLVIEKHFKDFVSEPDLNTIQNAIRQMQGQDKALRFERQLSHHDGTPMVIEALITYLTRDADRHVLLAMIRDITDRKRAEKALQQARDQLATLLAVSQNLVSTLELDPLLNLILDKLSQVIPYEAAAVLGLEHDRLEQLLYRGPQLPEDLKGRPLDFTDNPVLKRFSFSEGIVYIEDTHPVETLVQRFGGALDGWGKFLALYRTWLALPLLVKGELIGNLVLIHSQPDRFGPAARSLAQAIANQAGIAIENAHLYQQAQEAAVASERMRLARDLHDSVTQALYTISLYGEAARMALTAGREETVFENLDEIQSLAREATTDLRVLIYELRPPVLSEIGLAAALKNRLEAVEARAGMEVELQVDGEGRLPLEVETELFRGAQEALTNVLKHAHASRVKVHLHLEENLVRLAIQDNGLGFDLQDAEASEGVGLQSLRERIQRIGGTLAIETAPGCGTKLLVELRNLTLRNAVN